MFAELVGVTAVGLVAFLTCRRVQMRDMQLLRRDGNLLLRRELRRRVEMCSHANGLGGQSFPEPVETRSLTWVLCEIPCWSRRESIGLPPGSECRLEQLGADECDRHFASEYRLASRKAVPARRAVVAS